MPLWFWLRFLFLVPQMSFYGFYFSYTFTPFTWSHTTRHNPASLSLSSLYFACLFVLLQLEAFVLALLSPSPTDFVKFRVSSKKSSRNDKSIAPSRFCFVPFRFSFPSSTFRSDFLETVLAPHWWDKSNLGIRSCSKCIEPIPDCQKLFLKGMRRCESYINMFV